MTIDNIEFNSVKTSYGTKIASYPLGVDGQVGVDEFGGVINAVDIDWNGAQWNSILSSSIPTTINTTGDLLKAIKYGMSPQR